MPFTGAHPAIVLPLAYLPRRWRSVTGLVAGSLSPDFEYFLRMKVQSDYSHTTAGLFWLDIPLALVLAFLFHNIVRNPLFDNLPGCLASRLMCYRQFSWNRYFAVHWPVVICSVIVGAVSHIFWDAFTHQHGFFVQRIPGLMHAITVAGIDVPVFKMIQHISSLLGIAILLLVLYRMPADKRFNQHPGIKYWSIWTVITLSITAARFLTGHRYSQYGHLIVTIIAAALLSLVMTPLLADKRNVHN